jgi:hypothetical protein
MADVMTADEVAAYRDEVLTAQGLINDGTGNYYAPDYYDGRAIAVAAHDANVIATQNSGLFTGVQDTPVATPKPAIQTAVTINQPRAGVAMQYTNPNPNIKPIIDAAQLASIKTAYTQLVPGDIPKFVSLMNQYGVSIYDVANATTHSPAFIAAQLGQPNGFGGFYKAADTASNAASSGSGLLVAGAVAAAALYFMS